MVRPCFVTLKLVSAASESTSSPLDVEEEHMFAVTGTPGFTSNNTVKTKCNNSKCGLTFYQPYNFTGRLRCPHCNRDQ